MRRGEEIEIRGANTGDSAGGLLVSYDAEALCRGHTHFGPQRARRSKIPLNRTGAVLRRHYNHCRPHRWPTRKLEMTDATAGRSRGAAALLAAFNPPEQPSEQSSLLEAAAARAQRVQNALSDDETKDGGGKDYGSPFLRAHLCGSFFKRTKWRAARDGRRDALDGADAAVAARLVAGLA